MNNQNQDSATGMILACLVVLVLLVLGAAGAVTFYWRAESFTQQMAAEREMAEARLQAEMAAQNSKESLLALENGKAASDQLEQLKRENELLKAQVIQMSAEIERLKFQIENGR